MQVTIQNERLNLISSVPTQENSSLLFTENSNGLSKIFRWCDRGCELITQFNKNSNDIVEYIEDQLKMRVRNNDNRTNTNQELWNPASENPNAVTDISCKLEVLDRLQTQVILKKALKQLIIENMM
ncbi:hypothetical protein [Psychrobacillus sp. L3]|uniref:hypothetical protein n=1 Tax=Psychrobacillus sp. L3 TaxID=3236891 RepID=UPI0036F30E16